MNNEKFTARPWNLEGSHKSEKVIFCKEDDKPICYIALNSEHNTMANANLISAAPDMYKALEDFVSQYPENDYKRYTAEFIEKLNKAKAALKKANPNI